VPLVEVVGEAGDGATAVDLIDDLEPDIVFLDIEMPVMSGLQVVERLSHRPVVVFTTAYSHYAVTAFELAALDYLVKPFGVDRFRAAVERAVQAVERRSHAPELVERVRESLGGDAALSRLFVREGDQILPVPLDEIGHLEADGDYVIVHHGEHEFLIRVSLKDLQARLGERFVRVHRSHLVNLDHVEAFEDFDQSRLVAVLKGGGRVVASRARSRELRRLAH
jgi:two-component system LytT family response regulator